MTPALHPLDTPLRPEARRVLVADPGAFDVAYVINPHMEGQLGRVDRALARAQWEAFLRALCGLELEVITLPAIAGLPDLVFTANTSFPYEDAQGLKVIPSVMRATERQPEVSAVMEWYRDEGFLLEEPLLDGAVFEAAGDALWHPGRRFLYLGHGFRTEQRVAEALARRVGAPVLPLQLVDPRFYHLDTALCPLDSHTALIVPSAFTPTDRAKLEECFPQSIEVPEDEALRFAANAFCPDRRNVLLPAHCPKTRAKLEELGFQVIELDTSEFLKSGGSVFCMKAMVPG